MKKITTSKDVKSEINKLNAQIREMIASQCVKFNNERATKNAQSIIIEGAITSANYLPPCQLNSINATGDTISVRTAFAMDISVDINDVRSPFDLYIILNSLEKMRKSFGVLN